MELVVAITVLSVVAGGFAASVSLGLRGVAFARQQQTASNLASARLEHLRSIPYGEIALSSAPVHDADPTKPDFGISIDNTTYDIDGRGSYEPLVVDTTGGAVLHLEDPVQVGSTVMEIYQYVTWVDDPAIAGTQDYRRVTVVVQYKAPSINGVGRTVRNSSLFTPGTVTIGPTTTGVSTTTVPAATTTTSPATTTTAATPCPGDVSAPTGTYNLNGSAGAQAGFTAAATITVSMNLADPCTPLSAQLSNDGGASWGAWVSYDPMNATVAWTLPVGDGTKAVSFRARDAASNTATFSAASITLDATRPTTPGSFASSVTCSGANRTLNITWGLSTDANLVGYRVYRSTDGTTWSTLLTTTSTTASDTHRKGLDSVRFYVVAYDKAGNESLPTATISLAKNQCA